MRKATTAIEDVVEESLEKTQKEAFVSVEDDEEISNVKIKQLTLEWKKKQAL
jgi:hypothetical protein